MRLLQLELRNYRNYAGLKLEPGVGLNVFIGDNGQGKTNLLESVALLALSSSPRARTDAELVGPLGPEARVEAVVEAGGARSEIEIAVRCEEGGPARRLIKVNGAARRPVNLPGLFRAVLFWPEDLGLVKSGPELRRRLLNQMLVQVERGYAAALTRYARVLRQRNSLLKQVAAREQPVASLEPWDMEVVRLGGEIASARERAVEELRGAAQESQRRIGGGEQLDLAYQGPPRDLAAAVENSRDEDLRRGVTTVGPHRDDVLIHLEDRDARSYASQGQQRTVAVSIKLGEAALIEARTGESPVLLLDDVLSELDQSRRAALLERVTGRGQVVITAVEAGPIPAQVMAEARVHRVASGTITACG